MADDPVREDLATREDVVRAVLGDIRLLARSWWSVPASTLTATAVSGLVMYPFHRYGWAGWTWAGLSTTLGALFMVLLDKL